MLEVKPFHLKVGYIKLLEDYTIGIVKKIKSKRGEYNYNVKLEKGMIVRIENMSNFSFYKHEDELCIELIIKKKYNLLHPNNYWRGKRFKTTIDKLEGLKFEYYNLRSKEERQQKIDYLLNKQN